MCKLLLSKQNKCGKQAQKEELKVIFEAYKDINIDNVELLIRNSTQEYVVFLDSDLEVDFETTDEYDENFSDRKDKINTTYNRIEEMEHRPTIQYLSTKQRRAFARLLGNAFVAELDGCNEVSTQTLQTAEIYLKERTLEISHRWLLLGAFAATLVGFVSWKYFLPKDFLLFGCLGALFSILCKTGKLEYDCQSGLFLNILEILSRFLAAIISAYLAEQLYQLDLMFTALKSAENSPAVLQLICFVSGFSERLVPSIVSNFGSKETKEVVKE